MLYAITRDGDLRGVTNVPRAEVFEELRGRLTEVQFESIRDEISRRIEGMDRFVSSYIGAVDWTGTPLEDISDVACPGNHDLAAQFFGLMVWYHMMEHPDAWSFQVYEDEGGTNYFRINVPE